MENFVYVLLCLWNIYYIGIIFYRIVLEASALTPKRKCNLYLLAKHCFKYIYSYIIVYVYSVIQYYQLQLAFILILLILLLLSCLLNFFPHFNIQIPHIRVSNKTDFEV